MQLIPVQAPGTTNFKGAKSREASPAKVPDLPLTHAKTSNELYQNSIVAFTNSIRILPNEAFPYAGRAAAREELLKKMVNRVVMPWPIVGESADVGGVDPSLGTGNQQDGLPAKIDCDTIAIREKLIRDDYLMAKELDPDDPSVCLHCLNYFYNIKDLSNVISINIKSLKDDVDFPNYFQKQVWARITKGDIDGAIAELEKEVPPEPNRSWRKYQWKYYWLGQLLVWRATLDKRSDRKADLDKALENFSKYRSVGPGQDQKVDGWPYYARAWTRLDLGDPKGAIEDVEEAGKVGKSKQFERSLHDVRGRALVMQGKTKEAEVEFEALYNGPRAGGAAPEPVKSSRSLFALSLALARRDDLGVLWTTWTRRSGPTSVTSEPSLFAGSFSRGRVTSTVQCRTSSTPLTSATGAKIANHALTPDVSLGVF